MLNLTYRYAASHAATNAFQCGASAAARRSRTSAISAAYSPAESSPAHEPEALVQEQRVDDVGLAIVAHVAKLAASDRRGDLAAVHAELAGKAAQARDRVERRIGAVLEHREHVHEIDVPRVEAREVVVELEVPVLVAPIPVARGGHAVDERAMLQHGQVEAAAVPRYELRRQLLDARRRSGG